MIFNELLYKKIDDAAMGSQLGPTLANIFIFLIKKVVRTVNS